MEEDRAERISASLEAQFHACQKEADVCLSTAKNSSGDFMEHKFGSFLRLVRVNVQLAGVIAQLDAAKNRNSKTQ